MHPGDGRVVSNFIVQALHGTDITIYGDGSQTRSFCYVDDLVRGLLGLMDTPVEITGPVNLGNPVEVTIRDLAETIIDLTGSSCRIVHRPLPIDDPKQRRPDISKANEFFEWAPTTPLRGARKDHRLFRAYAVWRENSHALKKTELHACDWFRSARGSLASVGLARGQPGLDLTEASGKKTDSGTSNGGSRRYDAEVRLAWSTLNSLDELLWKSRHH